jgi:hypothetical protein
MVKFAVALSLARAKVCSTKKNEPFTLLGEVLESSTISKIWRMNKLSNATVQEFWVFYDLIAAFALRDCVANAKAICWCWQKEWASSKCLTWILIAQKLFRSPPKVTLLEETGVHSSILGLLSLSSPLLERDILDIRRWRVGWLFLDHQSEPIFNLSLEKLFHLSIRVQYEGSHCPTGTGLRLSCESLIRLFEPLFASRVFIVCVPVGACLSKTSTRNTSDFAPCPFRAVSINLQRKWRHDFPPASPIRHKTNRSDTQFFWSPHSHLSHVGLTFLLVFGPPSIIFIDNVNQRPCRRRSFTHHALEPWLRHDQEIQKILKFLNIICHSGLTPAQN